MEKQRHTEGGRVDREKGEEKERLSVGHLLMPRLKAENPWKVLLPRRQQQVSDTLPLVPFCRPQQQRHHRRRRHVAAVRGSPTPRQATCIPHTAIFLLRSARLLSSAGHCPSQNRWIPRRWRPSSKANQKTEGDFSVVIGQLGHPPWDMVLSSSASCVPRLLGKGLALALSCILPTGGERGFFSPEGFLRSCRASGWRILLYDLR